MTSPIRRARMGLPAPKTKKMRSWMRVPVETKPEANEAPPPCCLFCEGTGKIRCAVLLRVEDCKHCLTGESVPDVEPVRANQDKSIDAAWERNRC
jgi:hypothetical protein